MGSYRIGRIPVRVVPGIAALLTLILRATSAQSPAGQTAPPTTTIKVSTRLVTVDVVAQDHKGQPIRGLTKNDFELWEDGEPQEISVFSVEGNLVLPAPGGALPATLPLHAVANRPARQSDAPATATVILLDRLNTSAEALARARIQVAEFIRQMEPQDRVALYTMGANIQVLQDFTSDPALLRKALERVNPYRAMAQMATAPLPMANAQVGGSRNGIDAIRDPSTDIKAFQREDMTFSTFAAIGEHLAHVPGRKTLIWISYGIPLTIKTATPDPRVAPNETEFTPQIRRICHVLSSYHVAVYPIDARGVVVDLGRGFNEQGTSLLLADLTGGRAVHNDNDFALAMRSAIDDAKLTYVLGYYPAAQKWDSQFRTFKVRVNRPGAKLLYRSGYLAVAEQNQTPDDQQRMMDSALLSPLDSTAIGLRAQLQKSGVGGAQQLTLNLLVDINGLPLNHDHNLWQGELEVVIAQRGPGGDVLSESARKHSVKLNLNEDYYTQLQRQGLSLFFPVALDRHAAQLKVVVREINSGAMGSASIPLDKTAGE